MTGASRRGSGCRFVMSCSRASWVGEGTVSGFAEIRSVTTSPHRHEIIMVQQRMHQVLPRPQCRVARRRLALGVGRCRGVLRLLVLLRLLAEELDAQLYLVGRRGPHEYPLPRQPGELLVVGARLGR